jgi:hypothetical protein
MNDSGESPKIGYQSIMGDLSLRAMRTQDLRDISESIEELLSFSKVLPAELRIKLDTLHADVAVVLEDRNDVPGGRDGDDVKGPVQETT